MTQFGGANVVQRPKEKSQILENQRFAIHNVPGAGIEPARIAPLVFETSASTDSAIRALALLMHSRGVHLQLPVALGFAIDGQSGRVNQDCRER